MDFIVAGIQMCSSNYLDENLQTAEKLIGEAVSKQAKLVVLPENFAHMGLNETDKLKVAEPFLHGRIQAFLSNQAKQHGIILVGGTVPLIVNETHVAAACLVYDELGRCIARYDKMHLFDATLSSNEKYTESATVAAGSQGKLVKTSLTTFGLGVCYDIRFPELFRSYDNHADLIILPAAFTLKTGIAHWQLLARARAVENFCYFIGANQGGKHANGRQTYGHSLIVNPWGEVLAEINDHSAGAVTAMIDMQKLFEIRQAFPAAHHRKFTCHVN